MKSIIQSEKECFFCHTTKYLERHHVFGGINRKNSEDDGAVVYLCAYHHRGYLGVHFNAPLSLVLKKKAQEEWEKRYGDRSAFIARYGRSYL